MFRVCARRAVSRPTPTNHVAGRRAMATDSEVFRNALASFSVKSNEPLPTPSSSTASGPPPDPPSIPQAELDNMHHHIPPPQDPILRLLANLLMKDGKYATAAKRVAETLQDIHVMTQAPPLPLLRSAILQAAPVVKCLKHRNGGKTNYKPVALNERQRTSQGIRLLLGEVNKKGNAGKRISQRLALEVIDVLNGKSEVLKKKLEIHKLAMVNRGSIPRR